MNIKTSVLSPGDRIPGTAVTHESWRAFITEGVTFQLEVSENKDPPQAKFRDSRRLKNPQNTIDGK